jgi:acetolactate synthase-1/2/3 large subunit
VYQEIDDAPAFEPVTKWNATVDAVERFPDMLRQAFRVATSGAPGPVHLQFRGNEGQLDQEEAQMEPLVEPQFARVPAFRPRPDLNDLKKALQYLERAERPVIVAGGGARWSGAGSELVALAEALGIPVATSLNGKDCIPASHRLAVGVVGSYSRESANRVVAAADLVFFVGTSAGGMTTHVWTVPKIGVPAIQIDIEAETIGRNYPVKVGILGDVKTVLSAMLKECSPCQRPEWLEQVKAICREWRDKYRPVLESDAAPMRPERICAELSRHVPEDAIVLADTGHAGMWMGGMYDLRGRQSFLRSAGHLGWAFPAGLGAKCAAPERPVVTFTGDAGLWYHLGEIETAVRWNIAAVTVVNNNASGNQSKRGFDRAYGGEQTAQARELWTYRMVDLARVATDIGALGIRVERPRDFPPALEKAIASGKPAIVDVVTDIEAIAPAAVSG